MHAYLCRPKKSRVRLRARTPPFHGGDTGSNPVRGTTVESIFAGAAPKKQPFFFDFTVVMILIELLELQCTNHIKQFIDKRIK